ETAALLVGAEHSRVTYGDLAQLVDDLSAALRRRGLRAGDVVALQSSNSVEFVVALLGAARAGLVVAPLDPSLPSTERRARADRVGARVILTDARRAEYGDEGDCPRWCLSIAPRNAAHTKWRISVAAPG